MNWSKQLKYIRQISGLIEVVFFALFSASIFLYFIQWLITYNGVMPPIYNFGASFFIIFLLLKYIRWISTRGPVVTNWIEDLLDEVKRQ